MDVRQAKEKRGILTAVGEAGLNLMANIGHYVLPVLGPMVSSALLASLFGITPSLTVTLALPYFFLKPIALATVGAVVGAGIGVPQVVRSFRSRGSGWAYGPNGACSYTRFQANQELQSYLFSPTVVAEYGVIPQSVEILSAYGKQRWFGDTSPAVAAWMRGHMAQASRLSGYSENMMARIEPLTLDSLLRVAPLAPRLFDAVAPADMIARLERDLLRSFEGKTIFDERIAKVDECKAVGDAQRTSSFLQLVKVCKQVKPSLLSNLPSGLARACGDRVVQRSSCGQKLRAAGVTLKQDTPLSWSLYSETARTYYEDAYYCLAGVPALSEAAERVGNVLIRLERTYQAALETTQNDALRTNDGARVKACAVRLNRAEAIIRDVRRRDGLLSMPVHT